jgi:hypothetical protein
VLQACCSDLPSHAFHSRQERTHINAAARL